ncbi:MAG TPA: sodium:solute symporter [Firmicutes bacterium]|nr:sodium:solute symporter [Bacillota bacterium]
MDSSTVINLLILAVYIALMVGIGVYSMKSSKSVEGFLLGGRGLGPWLSAFAYGTSFFSAVIFIGYAGKNGWNLGISAVWIGVANALIGCLVSWLALAKPTRRMTHKLNSKTMPEFFQSRYDDNGLKIFSAIVIFLFLTPYAASVYMGLSYLFNAVFPAVDYIWWMVIMAVLTALYLTLGGYMATVLTDFVQGIIMIVGIVLVVYFVMTNDVVGGLRNGLEQLAETPDAGGDLTSWYGGKNWFSLISLMVLTSLGTWGLPQMVHKFYTIRDGKSIKQASVISTVFALLIGGGAYFIGAFGRLFLNNQLPEQGFDAIMPEMLNMALPTVMMGVLLVLILSASMSTLSSVVMTSASSITIDLIKGQFAPNMGEKDTVGLMRALCVIFVGLSFSIAVFQPKEIITLMSFSWGTVAGTFLGPYFWGLYSKKITRIGAWSGMICGFLSSIVPAIVSGFNSVYAPTFGMIAMAVSLIVTPVVSLYTPKYSDEFIKGIFD